jgi:hypothetical protein
MDKIKKDQELLQDTQAALEAETEEMFQVSTRLNDNFVRALKMMWGHLLVIWLVVIALFIVSFFIIRSIYTSQQVSPGKLQASITPAPTSETAVSSQALASQPPPPVSHSEGEEVREILQQVREAQLKKDINLFFAAYSPTFPGLADKKGRVLKTWERYNYLDMHFAVANVSRQKPNAMMAEVVWCLTYEDLRSRERTTLVKKFTVQFSKASGQWLIQDLLEDRTFGQARVVSR